MASTGGELSGAWNFRDVAEETGIRPGRLFRSSELSFLDDEGRSAFAQYGITDVADLRSPREVDRRGPGRVPDGAAIHQLPFYLAAGNQPDAPHEVAFKKMMQANADDVDVPAAAATFMAEQYAAFPTLPGAQLAVQETISLLADGRPVIAHCFAGKDRTGLTVALVLKTAGVQWEAIVADFLRSNAAVPQLRERIVESFGPLDGDSSSLGFDGVTQARLTPEVLGVREDYLTAAWRTIDDEYGSLARYLEAIGVTTDHVERLREALLG